MIKSRDPVREEFASKSTGCWDGTVRTGYYETKGHAVNSFDGVLQCYDLCLDYPTDFSDAVGRATIDVYDEDLNCVGRAIIAWHRMPSGRYDFQGYLA